MPVRTKKLWAVLASPSTPLYIVPPNETTIIKSVVLHNAGLLPEATQIELADGLINVRAWGGTIQPGAVVYLDVWWVLDPLDQVTVISPASIIRTWGSGTELHGVAD